jgi:hypothetical protein
MRGVAAQFRIYHDQTDKVCLASLSVVVWMVFRFS